MDRVMSRIAYIRCFMLGILKKAQHVIYHMNISLYNPYTYVEHKNYYTYREKRKLRISLQNIQIDKKALIHISKYYKEMDERTDKGQ